MEKTKLEKTKGGKINRCMMSQKQDSEFIVRRGKRQEKMQL